LWHWEGTASSKIWSIFGKVVSTGAICFPKRKKKEKTKVIIRQTQAKRLTSDKIQQRKGRTKLRGDSPIRLSGGQHATWSENRKKKMLFAQRKGK
jgi:hypothetical protein